MELKINLKFKKFNDKIILNDKKGVEYGENCSDGGWILGDSSC